MSKTVFIQGQGPVAVTMCPPGYAQGAFAFELDDDPRIDYNTMTFAHRQEACEDDCESTARLIHGDEREAVDAFYSRPLRLPIEWRYSQTDDGFNDSVTTSLLDRQRKQ